MLEAKWTVDPDHGKGHSLEKTISLFDETELSEYPEKLSLPLTKANDIRDRKSELPLTSVQISEYLRYLGINIRYFMFKCSTNRIYN